MNNIKSLVNCLYSAVIGSVITFLVMDGISGEEESKRNLNLLNEIDELEAKHEYEMAEEGRRVRREMIEMYSLAEVYQGKKDGGPPDDLVMVEEENDIDTKEVVEKAIKILTDHADADIPDFSEHLEHSKSFAETGDYDEESEDEFEDTVIPVGAVGRDNKTPYIISLKEFTEEHPEYDKISITYYEGDDSLIDEDDTEITDPGEILGLSWSGAFGIMSEDDDIVFVRNEVLGIDYEVLRDEKSWNEVRFGIDVYSGDDEDIPESYIMDDDGTVEKIPRRPKFDDEKEEDGINVYE